MRGPNFIVAETWVPACTGMTATLPGSHPAMLRAYGSGSGSGSGSGGSGGGGGGGGKY